MSKKINTEKFIGHLKDQIMTHQHYECEAQRKGDYIRAHDLKTEKETFKWLLLTITGEEDTDLGEFMEEDA